MESNFKVNMNEYLPLRDVVFNTLRQAILRGELKPGERLMEIQLANKLGVSRTPIREAIRKLELEGLVLMIPRKGAEVAEITEKNMRDVLEVRKALEELDAIPGTGYEGRLSKKDIRHYIEMKKGAPVADAPVAVSSAVKVNTPASSPATPVAAEMPKKPVAVASQSLSPSVSDASVEVKEMDRVRRIIADHMVMSKKVSPHVTNVVEVDVTRLVRWREKNKDVFFRREGVKLTYMPAIAEATAQALAAYPQVNVSVDGYNILYKKHINVGIAVSQDDGNLIVPVIHDADRLNLNGLAVAIDSLAKKARVNKLMPDDIDGGTFTITNFGTFKMLFGTPIINQPQVAILGVGVIEKKPAVVETPEGDVIAIRHKMYLSLSYDHRVVDGSLGGNFLHFIADYLENWKE